MTKKPASKRRRNSSNSSASSRGQSASPVRNKKTKKRHRRSKSPQESEAGKKKQKSRGRPPAKVKKRAESEDADSSDSSDSDSENDRSGTGTPCADERDPPVAAKGCMASTPSGGATAKQTVLKGSVCLLRRGGTLPTACFVYSTIRFGRMPTPRHLTQLSCGNAMLFQSYN